MLNCLLKTSVWWVATIFMVTCAAYGSSCYDIPDRVILVDQKCELIPKGRKISWGCMNAPGGCFGSCSEGVYAEPASVCRPNPGTTCVAQKGKIWVIKTHEGVCLSNCSCQELRRVPDELVELEAYRCN
jgi:hypothetical protein